MIPREDERRVGHGDAVFTSTTSRVVVRLSTLPLLSLVVTDTLLIAPAAPRSIEVASK